MLTWLTWCYVSIASSISKIKNKWEWRLLSRPKTTLGLPPEEGNHLMMAVVQLSDLHLEGRPLTTCKAVVPRYLSYPRFGSHTTKSDSDQSHTHRSRSQTVQQEITQDGLMSHGMTASIVGWGVAVARNGEFHQISYSPDRTKFIRSKSGQFPDWTGYISRA